MSKHTPGPWKLSNDSFAAGRRFVDADGRPIGRFLPHDQNGAANASLIIAAAPDMLEALQNLENDNGAIPPHAWALVQAAIAKATGGSGERV